MISLDLVRFLLGLASCVLESRGFANFDSKGISTISKNDVQIDVESIKIGFWEHPADVLETC